ncbi:hypothetical protein OQI_06260 [Streptomyces pharetrae CZA14]|uniref:Transposase IS701-like DDE domain-containing protein n=1 Tax=Streptomyces pharetrae CZA14 TaxID=1144883 RepID=A0ABX3YNZ7_9ACTN|nr:hypothetical protein OQI_06260 [Streptomyces pharetrae CZA14]
MATSSVSAAGWDRSDHETCAVDPADGRAAAGREHAGLQRFVNQSPRDPLPVGRRIPGRLCEAIRPEARVIDDVSFPGCGTASEGVARQYCGALGKRANCQGAVSVHTATDTASCPPEWELFRPEEWAGNHHKRQRTSLRESCTPPGRAEPYCGTPATLPASDRSPSSSAVIAPPGSSAKRTRFGLCGNGPRRSASSVICGCSPTSPAGFQSPSLVTTSYRPVVVMRSLRCWWRPP